MMKKIGMSILMAVALPMSIMAGVAPHPEYEPLSLERGRLLVAEALSKEPFCTGAWGNDISCILPFMWRIEGRGTYTYFSAAEQKHFDGRAWHLWEVSSGKLVLCKYEWSPAVDIWFMPEQLFEIEYIDGLKKLVFHNERHTGVDSPKRGERITLVSERWFTLSVATNGTPEKVLISDEGARALFCDRSMKSIRYVIPHMYCGAKAETPNEVTREQKRLREVESGNVVWLLSRTQKENLAALHRQYLLGLTPSAIATNVFIVACDGNIDGRIDAYISSDAECDIHGNYKWSLYIGSCTGFFRADKSFKFTSESVETIEIDSVVHVGKDAFFRFDRLGMPSYVMPLGDDGEFWSYSRKDSPVRNFRAKPGMQNTDFYCCIDNNGTVGISTGIANLNDVFLMHSMLVSAKRLPCETIVVTNKGYQK